MRRTALMLIAHGDRGGTAANRALADCVLRLRERLPLAMISAAFLRTEPSIEAELDRLRAGQIDQVLVYPFMMSNGYIATDVLRNRLAGAGHLPDVSILPPLGLDPRLGDLLLSQAVEASEKAGHAPHASRLLIVGHGSKISGASAVATRDIADRILPKSLFRCIATAFLEEPPFLQTELVSEPGPVVVAGFFSGEGLHGGLDVLAAINESGVQAAYTGPIGTHEGIPDLIAEAVTEFLEEAARDCRPPHSSSSSERPA
ncbi:MAG: hypothetical protein EKK41_09930 [Hyphomicrobiales bacterium]|nr:MAG: hypothetical protein EKK41_09930 [Hyphomicrobiales bacterium]